MRRIRIPVGLSPVPAVGFGCASLGSRISARQGRRALESAYAAGVTWFDLAPSYGDGRAETIFGQFAASRRHGLHVCTKIGLATPQIGWKSLLRPFARHAVARFPQLRAYATNGREVIRTPLNSATIIESVETSLRRLRVESLHALLLHEPTAEDVERQEVCDALGRLVASGKVHAVGVAGPIEVAERASHNPTTFSILQFANNPFQPAGQLAFVTRWRESGNLIVTHSALGAGCLPRLMRLLVSEPEAMSILTQAGYEPDAKRAAADFLVDYALATNYSGVSLFSLMRTSHLKAVQHASERNRNIAEVLRLAEALTRL